jgi:hypothetical protein
MGRNVSEFVVGAPDDYMQAIFDHIEASDCVEIALSADDGSTRGVRVDNGGGLVFADPIAAASWVGSSTFANTSYVVFEPSVAMPGGDTWQCLIHRDNSGANADMAYKLSLDGGWDHTELAGSGGFPATSHSTEGIVLQWQPNAALKAAQTAHIYSTDEPTYDSGSKAYTAFWCQVEDSGGNIFVLNVGGYVPNDPAADPNPVCALAAECSTDDVNTYWGYDAGGANCKSRMGAENAHTSQIDTAGYCFVRGPILQGYGKNEDTKYVGGTPLLYRQGDSTWAGTFHAKHIRHCDDDLPDYDQDPGLTKLVINDIMLHFEAP